MWWLIPIWIGTFVHPFFALFVLVLLSGWKMSIIRNTVNNYQDPVPEATGENFGTFIKDGVLLLLAKFFYFLIPYLLISIFGLGIFSMLMDVFNWIIDFNYTWDSFVTLITDLLKRYILSLVILGVWYVVGAAIYTAGKIRYADSGRAIELFNFFQNFMFVGKNLGGFFKSWIFSIIFYLIITVIGYIVLLIPIPLIYFIFTVIVAIAYFWVTGYEYGHMGLEARYNH
jgi:hypothetical protein